MTLAVVLHSSALHSRTLRLLDCRTTRQKGSLTLGAVPPSAAMKVGIEAAFRVATAASGKPPCTKACTAFDVASPAIRRGHTCHPCGSSPALLDDQWHGAD